MFKVISSIPFNSVLDGSRVATQVVALLNKNNNLRKVQTITSIANNDALYLVYLYNGVVIGCTGLRQENHDITHNLHTSVDERFRNRGLGKFIIYKAIVECNTPYLHADVRTDNMSSLNLYYSLGFRATDYYYNGRTNVYNLWRKVK